MNPRPYSETAVLERYYTLPLDYQNWLFGLDTGLVVGDTYILLLPHLLCIIYVGGSIMWRHC